MLLSLQAPLYKFNTKFSFCIIIQLLDYFLSTVNKNSEKLLFWILFPHSPIVWPIEYRCYNGENIFFKLWPKFGGCVHGLCVLWWRRIVWIVVDMCMCALTQRSLSAANGSCIVILKLYRPLSILHHFLSLLRKRSENCFFNAKDCSYIWRVRIIKFAAKSKIGNNLEAIQKFRIVANMTWWLRDRLQMQMHYLILLVSKYRFINILQF